uniref:HTH_48 domain-containing protein n=1 Tax=Steinernema glaseri TaxID=37863 RepID=A0A1I7YAC4_9BILA
MQTLFGQRILSLSKMTRHFSLSPVRRAFKKLADEWKRFCSVEQYERLGTSTPHFCGRHSSSVASPKFPKNSKRSSNVSFEVLRTEVGRDRGSNRTFECVYRTRKTFKDRTRIE